MNIISFFFDVFITWLSFVYAAKILLVDENPLVWKIFGRPFEYKNDGSTPQDVCGPEYKLFPPAREYSLIDDPRTERDQPKVVFSGYVKDLKGAPLPYPYPKIDIWHPDNNGRYSVLGYDCRGVVSCDAKGYYKFETAVPSALSIAGVLRAVIPWLKPSAIIRPPHFHLFINHNGKQLLCTQIYFGITRDLVHEGFGLPTAPAALLVKLEQREPDSTHDIAYFTGQYNFALDLDSKKKK